MWQSIFYNKKNPQKKYYLIIFYKSMGGDSSSPVNHPAMRESYNGCYNVKSFHGEVDKFYTSELSKKQFIIDLFSVVDQRNHPMVGQLRVCNTYILERLHLLLTDGHKGAPVNCNKMKQFIEKIYNNPEKAIEKSFRLFDLDGDKCISDAEFLNFMDNCFVSLMAIAEKDIVDKEFKLMLKQWMQKHKKVFYQYVLTIFQKFKKTDPHQWWVQSGENWTLDIQIGVKKYRTPLNILCLFAVPFTN